MNKKINKKGDSNGTDSKKEKNIFYNTVLIFIYSLISGF